MNYNKLVKPDTFIGQYMQYMSNSETAYAYDFWCGVWAIGVSCGRTVYVDRPVAPVRLNHYVILAAESGITRKSTAIQAISSIINSDHKLFKGRTGSSMLDVYLHEQTRDHGNATATFAVPELVTLLGREGFQASLPGLFTDLYDAPNLRTGGGTLQGGEIEQRNVYVNLLSASTPSWMVTAINPAVIEGGFTSRVIFVVDERRKRSIAWGNKKEETVSGIVQLQCSLRSLCNSAKEIQAIGINKTGLKRYEGWYRTRIQHRDAFQASFESREDDHVLKLACCLSINDQSFEINSLHIKAAIRIIDHVKQTASTLFGGTIQLEARLGETVRRVREILIAAGSDGLSRFELSNKLQRYVDKKELDVLMTIMHESGMIQIFEIKAKRGRAKTIYRATKAIEKFGLTNEVLGRLNLDRG